MRTNLTLPLVSLALLGAYPPTLNATDVPLVAISTTHHVCTNRKPLNVRDKPSLKQSTVIGQLPKHTNIEVIRTAADPSWSLLNLEDGQEGYAASKWICPGPAPGPIAEVPANPNDRRVCTKTSPLSVRNVPRIDGSTRLGGLPKDSVVTVGGFTLDNRWAWVETERATGWAASDYLCPLEGSEAGA